MQFPERELLPSQIERETIKAIFKKSIFLVLDVINVLKDNELDSHRNAILAIDDKTHGRNRTVNKNDSLNLSQIVTLVLEFWRSRQNTADAFNLLHFDRGGSMRVEHGRSSPQVWRRSGAARPGFGALRSPRRCLRSVRGTFPGSSVRVRLWESALTRAADLSPVSLTLPRIGRVGLVVGPFVRRLIDPSYSAHLNRLVSTSSCMLGRMEPYSWARITRV
jgi:hypothetical protein